MTRRGLLGGVAGFAILRAHNDAKAAGPTDRGIGGTGVTDTPAGAPDRGIGGTGVIGTIRKFGSIVVNDLRIAYPADVPVVIDGRAGTAADLRVGHVVRTTAMPSGDGLATKMIAVNSEVVGPVEKIASSRITVLGQDVVIAAHARDHAWTQGEMVAVSGLRRPDGAIVASLIEAAPGADARVIGPVHTGANGQAMIGNLRLSGLAGGLNGQRVLVEGQSANGQFAVRNASVDVLGFGPGIRQVSIEAYAVRGSGGARLGSGQLVSGLNRDLPTQGATRVVLTGTPGPDGRLDVTSLRREAGPSVPPNAGTGADGSRPGSGAAAPSRAGSAPRSDAPAPSRGSSGGGAAPAPAASSPAPAPRNTAPLSPPPSSAPSGGGGRGRR